MPELEIRAATEDDVPLIFSFIRDLAEYERLSHEVVATEETPRGWLFGERRVAEVVLGYLGDDPAGFALFFHTFSTFLGKPGIYLEDGCWRRCPDHRVLDGVGEDAGARARIGHSLQWELALLCGRIAHR